MTPNVVEGIKWLCKVACIDLHAKLSHRVIDFAILNNKIVRQINSDGITNRISRQQSWNITSIG